MRHIATLLCAVLLAIAPLTTIEAKIKRVSPDDPLPTPSPEMPKKDPKKDPAPKKDAKPKTDPAPKKDAKPKTDPAPKKDAKPKKDPKPKRPKAPRKEEEASKKADNTAEALYEKARDLYFEGNYNEAIIRFKQAADKGSVDAMRDLGLIYLNGDDVPEDEELAVYWFRKAYENGDVEAMFFYGSALFHGYGVEQDVERGLDLILEAARRNNPDALCAVGYILEGNGELTEAIEWYKRAAYHGSEDAVEALTRLASPEYQPTPEEVAPEDPEELYELGCNYSNGKNGYEVDYERSFYYFTKAAERGHSVAMLHLGDCYFSGKGVERSINTAFYWYKESAEAGCKGGMYSMGYMFEKGYGCSRDLAKAKEWYQKAADLGLVLAKEALERLE